MPTATFAATAEIADRDGGLGVDGKPDRAGVMLISMPNEQPILIKYRFYFGRVPKFSQIHRFAA